MRRGPATMKKSAPNAESPSRLIDGRIAELNDWRGDTLSRVRNLIKQADPEVVEEWKWRGVPVWSHAGMICSGETYKNVVRMTFAGPLSGRVETVGRPESGPIQKFRTHNKFSRWVTRLRRLAYALL